MSSSISERGPTRIAVFGSVAEPEFHLARLAPASLPTQTNPTQLDEDNRRRRFPESPPNAVAILDRTLELIAMRSQDIARPILDRAVATGTISPTERRKLFDELAADQQTVVAHPPHSVAASRVDQQIRAAIRRAAPGLAGPLLKEARASERLTAAQERRILERLQRTSV